MFDGKKLAEGIERGRTRCGLSQKELASRLLVSPQSVSKWERGLCMPDLYNLTRLAELFGVSVDSILGNDGESATAKCLIGIDGGGTKTEFVLFEEGGRIRRRLLLDSTNPNVVGVEKCCEVLRSGIDFMLGIAPAVGVFAGIAGCGIEKNRAVVLKFLKKQYPTLTVDCRTDIYNVIGCAPEVKRGTVAICGTGSVVYGFDGNELYRAGGWGYLLDRAGSGYDIGREALGAALGEREGHGAKTAITPLVEKRLGGCALSAIEKVYSREPSYVASFVPDVFRACEMGDAIAGDILKRNASHMAFLINRMSQNHDCGNVVVIAGGLFEDGDLYRGLIESELRRELVLTVPSLPQIYGACIQCCHLCGVNIAPMMENFESEYRIYTKEK